MSIEPQIDWPDCPRCSHRRQTICPFCKVAGAGLPVGDAFPLEPDSDKGSSGIPAGGGTLLICPTCDEPFRPQFFRKCENCGFDFGEGLEVPAVDPSVERLTDRAIWVLAGLILFSCAAFAYFAWVLQE